MKKEHDQNAKSHENEVQLRMHFEERLNNLHALNRTFQDLSLDNINKVMDRDKAIISWILKVTLLEEQLKIERVAKNTL